MLTVMCLLKLCKSVSLADEAGRTQSFVFATTTTYSVVLEAVIEEVTPLTFKRMCRCAIVNDINFWIDRSCLSVWHAELELVGRVLFEYWVVHSYRVLWASAVHQKVLNSWMDNTFKLSGDSVVQQMNRFARCTMKRSARIYSAKRKFICRKPLWCGRLSGYNTIVSWICAQKVSSV